jgi:hypothetical protein
MRKRYLIAIVAVLVMALAIWLVPLALAATNGASPAPGQSSSPAPSQGSGQTHQCPAQGGTSSGSSTQSSWTY